MTPNGLPSSHKLTTTSLPRFAIRYMVRDAGPLTGPTEAGSAKAAPPRGASELIAWLTAYPPKKRQAAIRMTVLRLRLRFVFIVGFIWFMHLFICLIQPSRPRFIPLSRRKKTGGCGAASQSGEWQCRKRKESPFRYHPSNLSHLRSSFYFSLLIRAPSLSLSLLRARASRDMTVPGGICTMSAISL